MSTEHERKERAKALRNDERMKIDPGFKVVHALYEIVEVLHDIRHELQQIKVTRANPLR
jgi:hypothetical protein